MSRRITVLFGAGASFGAGSIVPETPPLGRALFDELVCSYPGSWGRLPDDVQSVFRTDGFEAGMQIVYDRYGDAIPQLMREMAVYFIQFRPYKRRTLYCRLVEDLVKAGSITNTSFATLNYECVLEFSLLEAGIPVAYFPDNAPAEAIPVWKIHGSCNMFSHGVQAGQGVLYGTGVVWEGGAQAFFDANRVVEHCLVQTGLAPMMSLYMEGKPLNVSPSVIRQIQEAWAKDVASVEAVFVVGVRPVIQDTYVWEPLATTPASLYFVGDPMAFDAWRMEHRGSRASLLLGSRFNETYSALLERMIAHGTN